MTKSKLPPPYSTLEGVAAMLSKCDVQGAQKTLKKLIEIHNRLAEIAEGINDLAGYPKKLSPRFEYELKDKETLNFKLKEGGRMNRFDAFIFAVAIATGVVLGWALACAMGW